MLKERKIRHKININKRKIYISGTADAVPCDLHGLLRFSLAFMALQ